MLFSQKKIGENTTLNLFRTDKFKTNYVSINFIQPLSSKTASSFALLSRVLKRGCNKYKNQREISERLEELYASDISFKVFKAGDLQVINFSADMLDNSYAIDSTDITASLLELLAEIILNPLLDSDTGRFSEEYIESEKEKLIDKIKAEKNNKNKYAVSKCVNLMCANEIYGISEYGTIPDIKNITAENLYECYKKMLTQSKVQIFFLGNFELENIEKYALPFTEKLQKEEVSINKTQIKRKSSFVRTYEEDIKALQGKLSMGFRTGCAISDEDYDVFPLFLEIFGGSPTSKLFMNVREKMSLCYYCSAIPESNKGIMIVTAGIENKNKTTTEREILQQLEDVKNGLISDEEMSCAKASLKNSYMSIYDSPQALESWYFRRALYDSVISPIEYFEKVNEFTKQDVASLAKKITLDTIYFMNGVENGGENNE